MSFLIFFALFLTFKLFSFFLACSVLVKSFEKGLERTSRGKFEGGDTAWEEKNQGKGYSTSEVVSYLWISIILARRLTWYEIISIRENFQNNHGIYLCNSSKLCSIILKEAKKLKEKARRWIWKIISNPKKAIYELSYYFPNFLLAIRSYCKSLDFILVAVGNLPMYVSKNILYYCLLQRFVEIQEKLW